MFLLFLLLSGTEWGVWGEASALMVLWRRRYEVVTPCDLPSGARSEQTPGSCTVSNAECKTASRITPVVSLLLAVSALLLFVLIFHKVLCFFSSSSPSSVYMPFKYSPLSFKGPGSKKLSGCRPKCGEDQ